MGEYLENNFEVYKFNENQTHNMVSGAQKKFKAEKVQRCWQHRDSGGCYALCQQEQGL